MALVIDQLIVSQWQKPNKPEGLGFTIFGLTLQGKMYRYDNNQDGWIPCSMDEIPKNAKQQSRSNFAI